MKLSKEQKEELRQLTKMPWWKVLLEIEKEANNQLYERLATFNVDDEKDRQVIKKWQEYSRARNDFFKNTEQHLRDVYEYKIPWVDY